MKVLGIDVGIGACGYVIASVKNLDITLVKESQIKPKPKQTLPQKLKFIFEELKKEIADHAPKAIVVEKLYSHYRHPTTLGVLSQIKGIVALLAQQENIDYFEYSPTRARKAFLGKGSANSNQVKKMAENITGKEFKSVHTADAFSLIVAFSHDQKVINLLRDAC